MIEICAIQNHLYHLLNLYSTDKGIEIGVPVLLVDGYNVCGYWGKLKKHFMKGRLEIARDKLIADLVTFSTVRGLWFAAFASLHLHDECLLRDVIDSFE